MSRTSLVRQVEQSLTSRLAIGRKKAPDKITGEYRKHIYSWQTYRTYMHQCCLFVEWCRENHGCKSIKACRKYVPEYIASRAGLSAWTQNLDLKALQKLYQEYPDDGERPFGVQPIVRHREDIKRSRGEAVRDKDFSESGKYADLVIFCKCCGLRRNELQEIRGTDLKEEDILRVTRNTKGGRKRDVPVTGNPEEIKLIRRLAAAAGDGRIFAKLPSSADIHSYRADYCQRVYDQYARPIDQIPKEERYYCRGDKKGIVYDRKAMLVASQALGHNRIDVIASHYLNKH